MKNLVNEEKKKSFSSSSQWAVLNREEVSAGPLLYSIKKILPAYST